ncbi:S-layer homology domain-containing protein [Natronincola ferrireducens]|uniref:S-layer homology domain-containing protein n=1 Tax=Natronincola ferrireducens TaxID=393762 RepID=A0A1G8X1U9_9FIRM|nr:S-layer homology domain-containing protein [Natronincola ferrireducens]SDJ84513.1 S-layer homology domain-containing protein [Natronincola ferrireducens]
MKKARKLLILSITLLLLVSTTMTSFASTPFRDVSGTHWARQHITRMAEKKIIGGMLDEGGNPIFMPDASVTKPQALQMIYNTLAASGKLKSTQNYTEKYKSVMVSNSVPTWAHQAVAYALEHSLLPGSELAGLMNGSQQTNATRQQVAVYLGRALEGNLPKDTTVAVNFIDREIISSEALPYVGLLVKHKIISGDNNNRFNPHNTITRAQMAAMSSSTYDVLKSEIIVEVTPPAEPKTTTKSRTIISADNRTIYVWDNDYRVEMYTVESNTEVTINGVKRSITNLARDQKANLVFNEDDELIKIEVNPSDNKYEGVVESTTIGNIYGTITVRNDSYSSDRRRVFRVYTTENVEIKLDGKTVGLQDLKEDHQVTVTYDGYNAIKIIADTKLRDTTGLLESSVNFARYPYTIRIRIANNEVRELELDEYVAVRRDGRRRNLEDLVRGDIIEVTIEKDKVTYIEATSINVKREDEGVIQSIVFGNPNKITIVGKEDKEVTYEVDTNVSVYIDDERATFHDLRVDYNIELELQGNVIITIEGKKIERRNSFDGEIVRFHDNINRIIVKVYNTDARKYEEIPVYVNNSTRILDEKGKEIDMRYLDRRDQVFITGRYDDDVFIATRIIVIND